MSCSDRTGCETPDALARWREWTPKERRWIERLRHTLAAKPDSLGLFTTGGCDLTVFDRAAAEALGITHLWDGGAEEHGLRCTTTPCPTPVHGVSG